MLTRFAPSPTGYLHLGHAYAAVQAFSLGPCLLRIEDIDNTRSRPELTDAIYEDLTWLGFDWPKPVRVQREHIADYQGVIDTLEARGLLYEDYTTRSGREDRSLPPVVKLSTARAMAAVGTDRLSFQEGDAIIPIDLTTLEDKTLVRRDIGTSYHIAVTHDDWLQGVTDVTRGRDLYEKTAIHVLIQTLMGWPVPRYHHHGLVMESSDKDADKKMSKRWGSQTIRSLRESGLTPTDVLALARNTQR
ncbi:tRNA glutamyl-Q(34) synthetase GluQRS [Algimonas arctica]|uniref:tRNA glutamyl-Q(34) synthetase GluQRS n=1 Tax=Algimonas arctica TaxID=1479486 RepID=A0A8J3CS86_9PROT|nr:glutamate--tRNA ligase family protein [Algimonas arctica]GHA99568.1 tRNA glutamyl-Q(34) synthetase GluQRS [Algimonas arctica]